MTLPPIQSDAMIARLIREDWGRILAALVAKLGDYALAEDSLQDAVISALAVWPKGLPDNPSAWLITVARRKALDRIKRSQTAARHSDALTHWLETHSAQEEDLEMSETIPDHRLALIYTCCHPALEEKSRVALTLRALGGLTTDEIARAFLDKPSAMAARLTRAKKKIAAAGIRFKLPEPQDVATRTDTVLRVVYFIFNEGCFATSGVLSRDDLTGEAIRLGRILIQLLPHNGEVKGLLALMLLLESRRFARSDDNGAFIPLEAQNRARWDRGLIDEALPLVPQALSQNAAQGAIGEYAIQAAISALHAQASSFDQTDWPQIVSLYQVLADIRPNAVTTINQAVALSYASSPAAGLALLSQVEDAAVLATYQPFHACRADLLARAGDRNEAAQSYRHAIALAPSAEQEDFLRGRLAALRKPSA